MKKKDVIVFILLFIIVILLIVIINQNRMLRTEEINTANTILERVDNLTSYIKMHIE
jgi:hypothetical protein